MVFIITFVLTFTESEQMRITLFKKLLFTTSTFVLMIFSSCSANNEIKNMVDKTYSVEAFEKIELHGQYEVTIVQGSSFKLKISATSDDHKLLRFKNKNKNLKISLKKKIVHDYPIEVKIVMPNLLGLSVHGTSPNSSISNFSGENLSIEIFGSCDLDLAKCNFAQLDMVLNGSGTINALASKAESSRTTISGSGTIKANVLKSLNAQIYGVGTIVYSGFPKVSKQVHGMGTIKHI